MIEMWEKRSRSLSDCLPSSKRKDPAKVRRRRAHRQRRTLFWQQSVTFRKQPGRSKRSCASSRFPFFPQHSPPLRPAHQPHRTHLLPSFYHALISASSGSRILHLTPSLHPALLLRLAKALVRSSVPAGWGCFIDCSADTSDARNVALNKEQAVATATTNPDSHPLCVVCQSN